MVKHSYKLSRSAHVPMSSNETVNVPFDLNSVGFKRRPGRPSKPQPEPIQNAVLVFVHRVQNSIATISVSTPNMVVGPGAVYIFVGSVNGTAPTVGVGVKRGRRRPVAESRNYRCQYLPLGAEEEEFLNSNFSIKSENFLSGILNLSILTQNLDLFEQLKLKSCLQRWRSASVCCGLFKYYLRPSLSE
ncbi:Uncharacterized protein Fot_50483 [Forsythia ovata]|uniref:Uncharacterized protein n=1 Tax=Forsythia ovata TaxID=205694 RepID=A0ABD1PZ87_9LAMI